MPTDGALIDDVTATAATTVDALWTTVVRILDENDADFVHLLQVNSQ